MAVDEHIPEPFSASSDRAEQQACESSHCSHPCPEKAANAAPEKDLTMEGIESNPGPGGSLEERQTAMQQLQDVVLHATAAAVRDYISQPGIDVEMQNDKGDTPLLLAARRGDLDVVSALLDTPGVAPASVHTRNLKGSNALIAAAMKGHEAICRLLLAHGAQVNQCTDSSDTALSLAIWQNHTAVCLLLMDAGANVDNIDKFGDTMLLDAAKHGNVAVMHMLLDKQTVPIDHSNKKGDTALIRAAWKGEAEALTLLLDRGADPCIANKAGCTALIMACMHNNRNCVRLLIERETSPLNAVDETGRSAFAYLALYTPQQQQQQHSHGLPPDEPDWDAMMMLLERHVRIDTPANMGNLLLCRAANINQIALAELLLREGADITFTDPVNKDRPALLAHLQGAPDPACTRFLIEHGAPLDQQDVDGHTGLMFAIKHNNPTIAALLLDAGASVLLENRQGETATTMCVQIMQSLQTTLNHAHLMAAATAGNNSGSNSNESIAQGLSPASAAVAQAHAGIERAQRCLTLLLERSAREMGSGALLLQAAQHGDLDKLEQYLTVGVPDPAEQGQMEKIDVNFTDKTGRSALMLAARSNHIACVKFLLQHGALLNLRDKDGLTALTLAIRSSSRECAELLAETIQSHSLSRYGGGFHFYTPGPSAPGGGGGGSASAGGPGGGAGGTGGAGSCGAAAGAALATNSQIFGLKAPPQQMAQEEFDTSTNFLIQVADQLARYLTQGKQAVRDHLAATRLQQQQQQSKQATTVAAGAAVDGSGVEGGAGATAASGGSGGQHGAGGGGAGGTGSGSKPSGLTTSVSSPSQLRLASPQPSIPRSSSSYWNSFPSPTSASVSASQPSLAAAAAAATAAAVAGLLRPLPAPAVPAATIPASFAPAPFLGSSAPHAVTTGEPISAPSSAPASPSFRPVAAGGAAAASSAVPAGAPPSLGPSLPALQQVGPGPGPGPESSLDPLALSAGSMLSGARAQRLHSIDTEGLMAVDGDLAAPAGAAGGTPRAHLSAAAQLFANASSFDDIGLFGVTDGASGFGADATGADGMAATFRFPQMSPTSGPDDSLAMLGQFQFPMQ